MRGQFPGQAVSGLVKGLPCVHHTNNTVICMIGPEITGSEITGPEITGPEITGPEITGIEITGPEITGIERDDSSSAGRSSDLG